MALVRKLALRGIRLYQQAVSPYFPPCCRYVPSCSAYAYEAVRKYGIPRGLVLGLKRVLRCHPLCPGGYDPVP
ncbi:MAG: membrane protein insertion efficiency factor YidD [Treponema sp.]|jgi:putative membrane protein insertion efficiency factor|nr:membrane protein insertion efficiency factor YidD [Treponema sp.]